MSRILSGNIPNSISLLLLYSNVFISATFCNPSFIYIVQMSIISNFTASKATASSSCFLARRKAANLTSLLSNISILIHSSQNDCCSVVPGHGHKCQSNFSNHLGSQPIWLQPTPASTLRNLKNKAAREAIQKARTGRTPLLNSWRTCKICSKTCFLMLFLGTRMSVVIHLRRQHAMAAAGWLPLWLRSKHVAASSPVLDEDK